MLALIGFNTMKQFRNSNHSQAGISSSAAAWWKVAAMLVVAAVIMSHSARAADGCVINLDNNTHTCQDVSAISFVSQPADHQAVAKITLDPASGYQKAVFHVSYNAVPSGWTVDICDSQSCNGWGGDAGHTSNAAEVEVANTGFNAYRNTLHGDPNVTDEPLQLFNKPVSISAGTTISLEISDERLGWDFPDEQGALVSDRLFTLNGQIPTYGTVDYDIYAAFNRVIAQTIPPSRSGTGASFVRIELLPAQFVTEEQRILDTIEREGSARVIVGLKLDTFQPEGAYTPAEVEIQRNAIAQVQADFLDTLPSYSVVKTFKTVPLVALEIDQTLYEPVTTSPDVDKLWLSTVYEPSLLESRDIIEVDKIEAMYSGTDQIVVVIDTGVDHTHPLLHGRILDKVGACFSGNNNPALSTCPNGTIQQIGPGAGVPALQHPHGTHVAGIIAAGGDPGDIRGIATGAKIISINALSQGGRFYDIDLYSALEYIINLSENNNNINIAAVNMSLGSSSTYSEAQCTDRPMKPYLDTLLSYGVAPVIASGNSYATDELSAPACIASAISVGATKDKAPEEVAYYSNSADFLDLLAPGGTCFDSDGECLPAEDGIISTIVPAPLTAANAGTSMAAPHVAAAFAILQQVNTELNLQKTVADLLAILKATGVEIRDTRNGVNRITPRIQLYRAVEKLVCDSVDQISNVEIDWNAITPPFWCAEQNICLLTDTPATYDPITQIAAIPALDIPLLHPWTGLPTGEIAVFALDLAKVPGVNDFQMIADSLVFLDIISTLDPNHAYYEYHEDALFANGGRLNVCVLVPSVVVLPGIQLTTPAKRYAVTLRQLAVQSDTFHIEQIELVIP